MASGHERLAGCPGKPFGPEAIDRQGESEERRMEQARSRRAHMMVVRPPLMAGEDADMSR